MVVVRKYTLYIMAKERYRKIKLFFKYLFRGIVLSLFVALFVFGWFMWQVEQAAKVTSDKNADAAIILGAAVYGNEPSPVFRERIRHGVNLYKEGRVEVLIFTGGTPKKGYPPEAEVGKNVALKEGIPEQSIIVENRSRDTEENFIFTKKQIQGLNLNSFLIVRDPYHMYRAMNVAQDQGFTNAYPSPTPTSRFNEPKSQWSFLLNETLSSMAYKVIRLFF